MLIIDNSELIRQQSRLYRQQGMSIALVPTGGNLHAGHLQLVEAARRQADVVIVSIFINPLQHIESVSYPHTLQQDCEQLKRGAVDTVFAPQTGDFYPYGIDRHILVDTPAFSAISKDENRTGYFCGTLTTLCKLFNLLLPDSVCFGEKDYQQLHIIRRMVRDLSYDIDIISVPVMRNANGLALSWQNSQLNATQRALAAQLYPLLQSLASRLTRHDNDINALQHFACTHLTALGFQHAELHIRDADTLLSLAENSQRAVILLAAWLGEIRFTDNLTFTLPVTADRYPAN